MSVQILQSHRVQLICAALAGSLATVGALTAYQRYMRRLRRLELQREVEQAQDRTIPFAGSESTLLSTAEEFHKVVPTEIHELIRERVIPIADRLRGGESPDYLFKEQLARNYAVFKEAGIERIKAARVVVVGCGGVGSWAAVMLVRSCVESRTLPLDNPNEMSNAITFFNLNCFNQWNN